MSTDRRATNYVGDYGAKITGALGDLFASPVSAKVLALCNRGRENNPASKLVDRVLIDALSLNGSEFVNWAKNPLAAARPTPGLVLDLAALLGFAPPTDLLAVLEQQYEEIHGLSPYPGDVYRMTDPWLDGSPACLCWSAFVGSQRQLEQLSIKPERSDQRGALADEYLRIYREFLPSLTPQLFERVHRRKDAISLSELRIERGTKPYVRSLRPRVSPTPSDVSLVPASPQSVEQIGLGDQPIQPGLWDGDLPTFGTSSFEVGEKATLYGGRSHRLAAGFTPLQFTVARHSFDREAIEALRRDILGGTKLCRSFTVKAGRGAGLTMALAQLVRDLSDDEGSEVRWILGDPQRVRSVLLSLDESRARELAEWAAAQGTRLQRLAIVIDDVSLAMPREIAQLLRFRDSCKVLFSSLGGPQLVFIFGSFGAARTCSEDAVVELALTRRDQETCYVKMAHEAPTLIAGHADGLGGLIRDHPETRWHADDAQALIDFLMEHGEPSALAAQHWLARTDDLHEVDLEILSLAASAQLLGLHIPERVAIRLFADHRTPPFEDAEDIAQTVSRLAVYEKDWQGVGLSCPRRAESILERTGRFHVAFLIDAFDRLLTAAFDESEARPSSSQDVLSFVRHVIQRLTKRELYVFRYRDEILNGLLGGLIGRLERLAIGFNIAERAQWAGTLSGALRRREKSEGAAVAVLPCARLVTRLCESSVAEMGQEILSPEITVSLLRAGTRLVRDRRPIQVEAIDQALEALFTPSYLREIVRRRLVDEGEDRVRRANEIVHAYCTFVLARHSEAPPKQVCYDISAWLAECSRIFAEHKAALDAGVWLQRARFVWLNVDDRRQKDLSMRTKFIDRADACIEFNPQAQATWTQHVVQARRRLVIANGQPGNS